MIFHRDYDTDAYFSSLLTFYTCPPHSPIHPFGLLLLSACDSYWSLKAVLLILPFLLLVGLKAVSPCTDSFLVHCLILCDSCCTLSMYIRCHGLDRADSLLQIIIGTAFILISSSSYHGASYRYQMTLGHVMGWVLWPSFTFHS
jgi:hypothetical protein